jgi:hypothetical protein
MLIRFGGIVAHGAPAHTVGVPLRGRKLHTLGAEQPGSSGHGVSTCQFACPLEGSSVGASHSRQSVRLRFQSHTRLERQCSSTPRWGLTSTQYIAKKLLQSQYISHL